MVALNAAQYGDMGAISPWCFQVRSCLPFSVAPERSRWRLRKGPRADPSFALQTITISYGAWITDARFFLTYFDLCVLTLLPIAQVERLLKPRS